MTETCENCGRKIGKLETPRLFQERVVCHQCWNLLQAQRPVDLNYATPSPANATNPRRAAQIGFLVACIVMATLFIISSSADSFGDYGAAKAVLGVIGVGLLVVGILIWIISAGVKSGMDKHHK